jgi:surfeit locus 1 family protein
MRDLRWRDWAFIAFLLAVTAICIRLGIWQISRHLQRAQLNAELAERMAMPILVEKEWLQAPTEYSHFRVQVEGTYDPVNEVVIENRTRNGQPGVHLLTPMILDENAGAVMVDRGWIPAGMTNQQARAAHDRSSKVIGVLRDSQSQPSMGFLQDPVPEPGAPPLKSWRVVDLQGIGKQLPYDLVPVYIMVMESDSEPPPYPNPDLELSAGTHLGYALQWFAFASIALVGMFFWVRRRIQHGPEA